MIEDVIDGVAAALRHCFGEEVPVYTDDEPQGISAGAMMVRCVRAAQRQFMGSRYKREHAICVYYFPKRPGDRAEISAAIEGLFASLEMIKVGGDPVRGRNLTPHTQDGVLSFTAEYDFFVVKAQAEEERMQEIEMRERIDGKEG